MMKLGIISNFPSPEQLAYVRSLGLSFVEMCNNYDHESQRFNDTFHIMKQSVADAGLFIGSIGRWNAEMNKGGKVNEEEYRLIESNLDKAISVGCPTFVTGVNYDGSVSLFRNYAAAIEIFGRLIDHAKGTGTRIASYNCDWNNFVNNAGAWSVVLGELPELYIKWDPSHSYNAGRDYLREVSDWGDRFAHVHVKGAVKTGGRGVDDPPAGMDDLGWGSIFAALYARGYDGCLSIEPHSAAWMPDSERGKAGVAFTVDYISRFIL